MSGRAQTAAASAQSPAAPTATPSIPTFRSAVDLVSVAAVVRDKRGNVVRNLSRDDFQVFEDGKPRRIVEFAPAEDGPVSIALLIDVSGSMAVASNLDAGKRAIAHLVSWLRDRHDEVALFTFDSGLHEELPFTNRPARLVQALDRLDAFGTTSLYDAIGETARRLGERSTRRRAIVVLTDGVDTSSRHTPAQVSAIASGTDVPVYVVAVVSPADYDQTKSAADTVTPSGSLADLAWWTGGNYYVVSTAAHASVAARTLLAELRHQYVLAFESAAHGGWRSLDVRLRRGDLTVRARTGYFSREQRPLG